VTILQTIPPLPITCENTGWAKLNGANAVSFVVVNHVLDNFDNFGTGEITVYLRTLRSITRGQSNLTNSASRGANSPVRGHTRGSKFVPLNSWGRDSY